MYKKQQVRQTQVLNEPSYEITFKVDATYFIFNSEEELCATLLILQRSYQLQLHQNQEIFKFTVEASLY
eukprot:TRINITY_DN571_c0_g1_i1.p3 TRINITY_DN571_c0_g1~~TRINITY_DN571_c0_g1_i1.p3  ORF type:complete len:69 (+),score=6.64 TRINITY_DN571_c0_g1_i1:514-720(+)